MFKFPVNSLGFPAIYDATHKSVAGVPRYGVKFQIAELPGEAGEFFKDAIQRAEYRGKTSLYAETNFRPLVSELTGQYARMRDVFEIADLRNFSRDRLFRGVYAEIAIEPYEWNRPDGNGTSISLISVAVHATALESNLPQ